MKGDFSRDTFDPLKHFSRVLEQQGRVRVDADSNEQTAILLHYLRTLVTDLIGPYAGPQSSYGFEIGKIDKEDFKIGFGRYYVDGILCENEENETETTYKTQKDYPNPLDIVKGENYLVYLDVWERHITALEDDYIREKALGGPDTASRAKVVWQVKIDKGDTDIDPTQLTCQKIHEDDNWESWKNRWQFDNRGLLRARVKRPEDSTDPCLTAPDAKYRGQENQLYRIEIHQGCTVKNGATFKWSRDNGSVVTRVLEVAGSELIVEKSLGFEPGIWIELSNDEQELRGEPGSLVKLIKVEGDHFTLESLVEKPSDIPEGEKWPTKSRRWDQRGDAIPVMEGEVENNWLEIENGIEIQFNPPPAGKHTYRTGDYWLIPARVATGDIEWPVKLKDGNTDPIEKEPFGIQHHYAPLAILTPNKPHDCRRFFKPKVY